MNNIDVNQYEFAETSRKNKIKSAIEAMLFVAGEPLNIKDIYTNLSAVNLGISVAGTLP